VYNSRSEILYGSFRERLAPGCFDRCLADSPDLIATVDHDPTRILGRSSAGTLRMNPTTEGVDCEVDQADYTYARDLAVAISRGDISGMSFIFDVTEDSWSKDPDGIPLRTVTQADIFEVSFVHFPAYLDTDCDLRSAPLALPVAGEARAVAAAKASLLPPLSVQIARLRSRAV
jgi:uncharacterized protein